MVDKHNESLLIMPKVFSENGFAVTVCDPPYAGYEETADLSIFDNIPNIAVYNTRGKYQDAYTAEFSDLYYDFRARNFFWYSMFKMAPILLQPVVYDSGEYYSSMMLPDIHKDFRESYPVLENLKEMTTIENTDRDMFLMIANDATHGASKLQMPNYEPGIIVNNERFNTEKREDIYGNILEMTDVRFKTYGPLVASFQMIGEWLDYLRQEGVYDNTRIIIVSDHAYNLGMMPDNRTSKDASWYNALFMVKDFNATGFHISTDFMTNADTIEMAMSGLIDKPINPFSGNDLINPDIKTSPQIIAETSGTVDVEKDAMTYDPISIRWLTVRENIFDPDNWGVWTE